MATIQSDGFVCFFCAGEAIASAENILNVDLSRLTESGMIVGTLAYMPPEQAMGGAVTARTDLYSLGAMLYEMVAGRRPFIGEDALAVIGQHINTPPVSPAWHRADLPPALEALILQLLEKDPNKRPESALAVYQALESIEAGKFSLDILRAVANINEDIFVKALQEAVRMSVLEERSQLGSIRYRFTHAFFRQTMYGELIAPQRLKLHQLVARSLETQYAKRIEEHAAELAEHFSHSSDAADLARAVSYGEIAAQRAVSVYAYGEAVRLLEQALKVQKVLGPNDRGKVCDLLLALGFDLIIAGEPQRAFNVELQEAFSLAESIGDKPRAAQICSWAMGALVAHGASGPATWAIPEAAQWVERADRHAAPDTVARVWADVGVGNLKVFSGFLTRRFDISYEGSRLLIRNLELARRLNDPEAFVLAATNRLQHASAPRHAVARFKLAEELAQKLQGISALSFSRVAFWIGDVFLEYGQRRRAEEFFSRLKETAERTRQANWLIISMFVDSVVATLDGNLQDAVTVGQNILKQGEQLGLAQFANLMGLLGSYMALLHLGRLNEIPQMLKDDPFAAFPSVHANIVKDAEAVRILEQYVLDRPGIESGDDETWAFVDIMLLQAAVRVRHQASLELLLRPFCRLHHAHYRPSNSDMHTTLSRRCRRAPWQAGRSAQVLCRSAEGLFGDAIPSGTRAYASPTRRAFAGALPRGKGGCPGALGVRH
jgi:tetratricopeptide (TPR) repeat protein